MDTDTDMNQCICQVHSRSTRKVCCQELLLCIQLPRKDLTAVKELAHILATKDLYQKFDSVGKGCWSWRLSRQEAGRMLQTLEKGLNGGLIFEFKEIEDDQEWKEQQRLSKLWEQYCGKLGFDIERRDKGCGAWVARPRRPSETTDRTNHFISSLRAFLRSWEAYEFVESADKALLLQRCVEELKQTFRKSGLFSCRYSAVELERFAARIQEHLQMQSVSTLQSLSTFLMLDIDALVTSSPSRYVVWCYWVNDNGPPRASQIEDRFNMITWCTWVKSMVDEVLAMRCAEDTQQHHHELKGLLQEVSSKLPLRGSAPKADAADDSSDASWVQVRSEIASISESWDSSTSSISVETFGCPCFMTDSVFKAPDGSFVSSQQLVKGSKVLAGFDGGSILSVNNPPEQHQARATFILYAAGGAKLQVTPDHRIVLATSSPALWRELAQDMWMFSLILQ